MTRIRRLVAVCAILTVAVVYTCAHVWGDSGGKPHERQRAVKPESASDSGDGLAAAKFTSGQPLTYRTKDGDLLFALQVKPKLEPLAERPCDYLLLVDISASQVGQPLANARKLVEEVVASASPQDRVAIWTVNIPEATRVLSGGFLAPQSERVQGALKTLAEQVPLGDTDLNKGIAKAVAAFEIDRGRRRAIVFLGDGMSVHNPLTPADRARLCEEMVKNEIAFFPVPLGPRLDPQNLHGLASGTGGQVVRILPRDKVADSLKRLHQSVSAPVLYPTALHLTGADPADCFPTRLPPLRGDAPTLMVGRAKGPGALTYTVEGTVAGRDMRVEKTETLPEPELDNFFLVGMVEQWKTAKDQPALMQGDRALAFAFEMNQMARAELLAQAEEALARDKLDAAGRLFNQVQHLDPNDPEAKGGLKLVMKLREGKVTKDQLRQQFARREGMGLKIEKSTDPSGKEGVKVLRDRIDKLLAQAEKTPPKEQPGDAVPPPPPAAGDLLQQQRQRQAVEEQRTAQSVDDALREARRLLPTDPEGARDLLKRVLGTVRDNPDISETSRGSLLSRLETTLRNVDIEGARITRDQAERLRLQAVATERLQLEAARTAVDDRTRARMRVFHNLMDQGRFEEAYKQALGIIQDNINQGLPVPVAATAAYDIGLTATNLREVQELRRIREERYLLTMLQVEKSHVPFPDEPPVQFPPAATWREITRLRKEKYESSGLTEEDPAALQNIRRLRDKLAQPISLSEGFDSGPLRDALGFLSERYGFPIIVDTEAFKNDNSINDIESQTVKLGKMVGVSLGTVLRLLLAQVNGTYIIRREFVEVTTTQRQLLEKTIRVYPVADLVIPIPNAINQNAVNQTIQNSILGFQIDLARASLGGFLGGIAGLAGGGLVGVAGIGGGLAGLAGIGGLGGGLAGIGGLGGGFGGGLAGNIGGVAGLQGGGGPQNLGVGGGGLAGFAGFGGQLGQLGNLGGQFGLQGGDQSRILIKLITQVIGTPNDWAPLGTFQRPETGTGIAVGKEEQDDPAGDPNTAGSLGYYPPSRALIVKGTSRIHTRLGGGLFGPRPVGPPPGDNKGAQLDNIKKDFLARRGDGKGGDVFGKLSGAADKDQQVAKVDGDKGKSKAAGKPRREIPDLDARKIWQEALAKGVTDPGLIIAVADFLFEHGKFTHAAEFLKADLRQGIVARPWVYQALALALREGGGSTEDIERAELSAVDVEPQDAQGYLRASQAMAEFKRYDRAVAYCRQASLLEPNAPTPYAEALLYAEMARDSDAMEWAAGNLLSRDWPVDSADYHAKAQDKLKALTRLLAQEKRQAEAERLTDQVNRNRQRDLVIRASWSGEADIDLEVKEPIGTTCSFQQRQTPGGGILLGDNLTERNSETYAAAQAFPGTYEVTLRRIWGRPLGSKVTLEVIEHQGTPEETHRRETIAFDRTHALTVILNDGRRHSVAQVPPPSALQKKATIARAESPDRVFTKLRALADPDLTLAEPGMKGGAGSLGRPSGQDGGAGLMPPGQPGQQIFQGNISRFGNGADLTAQATVSPDRRYVRLSLAPVFDTVTGVQPSPFLNLPGLPGGIQPPGR
jgi:tetratricopeptide (TPR) repeat protein